MQTRRERAIARLERRQQWAESRDKQSQSAFDGVQRISSNIPFGQPILVGHHSERHARADARRMDNGMRKSVECSQMADHHRSKAQGIETQLANTIFSDDENAVESLQAKIDKERALVEQMKNANKVIRKFKTDHAAGIEALQVVGFSETQAQKLFQPDCMGQIGFASYSLTNRGANIRRMEKRIVHITNMKTRTAKAEAQGGIVIEGTGDYIRVTFADKPSREILNDLRGAGFYWGSGSWTGKREKLPASVNVEPLA